MPKDLPGFYYDAEKNRYFPYKGRIPGSSSKPPPIRRPSEIKQDENLCQRIKLTKEKLLQARELCGNVISSRKGKVSIRAEFQKRHASRPNVWKYNRTKNMANIALEHVVADVTSPHGLLKRDILFSGGANGLMCLFQVGKAQQDIDPTQIYEADQVWPFIPSHRKLLKQLGSSYGAMTYVSSDVSCIKASRSSLPTNDTFSKYFLITTLGSDCARGSVYLLDLSKPLDFDASVPMARKGFFELAAFRKTLWTADCNLDGGCAAIGTNRGVALLNIESGASSWALYCKSDVLTLQINQGNSIISGLRNGKILTVDSRKKQNKGSTNYPSTVRMPSSVCCLTTLKTWDQYFLASSLNGSIVLYDHRMLQRGPVQSYEGNVNTHTRIQLGVDPSEKVVMSGGEDCYLRIWDIKSGDLIFKDKFMNSIPSAVCWPRSQGFSFFSSFYKAGFVRFISPVVPLVLTKYLWPMELQKDGQDYRCYWEDHQLGSWVGSDEGIFYMDWL